MRLYVDTNILVFMLAMWKERMGTIVFLLMIGIPCLLVLLWWETPKGRHWLQRNNLL